MNGIISEKTCANCLKFVFKLRIGVYIVKGLFLAIKQIYNHVLKFFGDYTPLAIFELYKRLI